MSDGLMPIVLPARLELGDCVFDVEASVSYNRTEAGVSIEEVTLDDHPIELSQPQYEELADHIKQLINEGSDGNN